MSATWLVRSLSALDLNVEIVSQPCVVHACRHAVCAAGAEEAPRHPLREPLGAGQAAGVRCAGPLSFRVPDLRCRWVSFTVIV